MTAALIHLAVTAIAAGTTYYVYLRIRTAGLRTQHGCQEPPRYAHKEPFFGLDLFFRNGNAYETNTFLVELTDMYNKYGNTFEALNIGSRMIYTIEPDNLRTVFTSNAADWGIEPIRLAPMEPFCGRGFLTVDGDLWHRSRRMFQPSFDKRAIADFSAIEEFFQAMLKNVSSGNEVDMAPLLSSMFIDATTLFLFGESISDLRGSTSADVSAAFDAAMFGSGMRIALGPLGFLGKTSKWLKACRRAQSFAESYVEKALELPKASSSAARKTVLLHSLAEQTTDKEHLRNEVLQAFFVSQGTTANCVSNTLFLVSRASDLWARLRSEVLANIGQSAPTYEQIQRLPLLRNVLNESLRILPILPQNNRVALRDTILPVGGGLDGKSPIFVEKGAAVSISYYNLQRRSDLWGADAADFKPERWEAALTDQYTFLPFGAGPRQCIGRDKALIEASYVLVRLLQEFSSLASRDDRPWKGRVQLSAQNVHGCRVAFLKTSPATQQDLYVIIDHERMKFLVGEARTSLSNSRCNVMVPFQTEDLGIALSPEEQEDVRLYAELLVGYKGQWTDVDLTGAIEPPKYLFDVT